MSKQIPLPKNTQEHYPAKLGLQGDGYESFCACGAHWPCRQYIHPASPNRTIDPEARDLAIQLGAAAWGDCETAEQGWPELYDAALDMLRFGRGEPNLPALPADAQPPRWTIRDGLRPAWLPARYGYFVESLRGSTGEAYSGRSYVRLWDCSGETFWEGETISLGKRGEVIRV